ncbi:hypothetical protein FNF27_05479 [Cafeteria roenbergensis]|nr:hypothetical protein FNF31_01427 [Cafeteria roenbergensis]KAA0172988.1 hypothetical protein FNF27_05479 [Cafeteria roenbergensis]
MAASDAAADTSMDLAYDAGFAEYYDEHFGNEQEDIRTSVKDWLSAQEVPNKSIVDVGCGSGHLLEAIVEDERFSGWSVAGFDLSKHMAAVAASKLGDRATVWVDSATTWTAKGGDGTVGVVSSTFNAFNHIPGETNIADGFKRAAAALAPGGVLILDVLSRLGFDRLIVNTSEEAEDGTGGLYISSGARVDANTVALRELVYMPSGDDGLFKRIDSHVCMYFYDIQRLKDMIEAAGLTDVQVHAGYETLGDGCDDVAAALAVAKSEKALEIVFTARKAA